ncbi:energy-coupling factor transporter transmembrane component T [Brevibacillus migulae]|uniref:energy-coupling factor transporter transmembrane component T n=1 Tax=Brevibacillus migulae TaxID=1644114 RepID=UPI001F433CF8|nr:energy-coupling factor transporter transmembrane component T [Brevibacillus migulae]
MNRESMMTDRSQPGRQARIWQQAHPGFVLLFFVLLGALPFIFQDPRILVILLALNLLLVSSIGWPRMVRNTYLLVGGVGGLFTALSWLPFTSVGEAYWRGEVPLIGYPLQITDIGVMWGLGMGLRIANVALLSMYYLFVTTPRQMAMGFKSIGIPFSIGFLFALIFRFIPLAKQDLTTIREAQMVRGVRIDQGSLREKMRKYGVLLAPLIFSSLRRVQLIANALDAKGFAMRNPRHRYYRMPEWGKKEILLLLLVFLIVISLFYAARISPNHFGVLFPSRI